MLPRVDLFMLGLLLGLTLGIALTAVLAARQLEDERRRHAFGLKRHPAFRK